MRFCGPVEPEEIDEEVNEEVELKKDEMKLPSSFDDTELVGKLVAALTLTTEGTEEWILARICAIKEQEGEGELVFEVEDAEVEGEPEEKESHLVKKENIIFVPKSDDAALEEAEFKLRQSVLALYPGTTCFYSAVVMSTPSRVSVKNNDTCSLSLCRGVKLETIYLNLPMMMFPVGNVLLVLFYLLSRIVINKKNLIFRESVCNLP